jgi:hypothetical protein
MYNPPDELKIYELSLIWKEAAYNFAFWERMMPLLDWDRAYRDALPAVLATHNLYEYYLELMKFTALLRDGHTGTWWPKAIDGDPAYTSKLPIRISCANGNYVISNVKRVAGDSVRRWSIVRKINGEDVSAYVERNVFPYIWHEKLDSAAFHIHNFISMGPMGSTAEFELEHDGEIYTVALTRTKGDVDWLYDDALRPLEKLDEVYKSESHRIEMTRDGIAVITIDTMMNDALSGEFYANIGLLQKAWGYVIDIRRNGGGNSNNSDAVAAAFIEGGFPNQRSMHPIHIGAYKAWGVNYDFGDKTYGEVAAERGASEWWEKVYKIPRQAYYEENIYNNEWRHDGTGALKGPLVILTTADTASAAENFLVIFEHAKRATFVGTATNGSTGNPLHIPLESGGGVRICTRHSTHIDGREFINTGILPHVRFEPSMVDLREGVDSHMGKGLEVVRGMIEYE